MDIEKLIEDLQWWAEHCDRTNYGCETRTILSDAATAISTLQIENQALRNSANGFKAENEKLRAEREILTAERDGTVADMTALMAGQCCDLCSVEYCNDRGKTEMCTAFKWSGIKKED